ncbi:MAG: glycosyltransferase family 2 protein [Desulfocapsaceae bacterium]
MAKKNKINLALNYLFNRDYRDYRIVRTLSAFDPDYFLTLLKRECKEDVINGFKEADDPLWFYFEISRKQISSVNISQDNWIQLLDPHPLFDTYFYLSHYRKQIGSRHPFSHYLMEGWKSDLKPSPFFDPNHYRKLSGFNEPSLNPWLHYLKHDLQDGLDCSLFFSHGWYLDKTPLPESVQKNAIKHYKLHGSLAGKSPIPVFEAQSYVHQLGGESGSCSDPLLHYLSVGEKSGLSPNSNFDLDYYQNRYPKSKKQESPLGHYLREGLFEQCEINSEVTSLIYKPIVSVVVPVYNPTTEFLNNCVRSVLYQTYPYWELWLVDDCSSMTGVRETLEKWAAHDKRITCVFNDSNEGISAATQIGADLAQGEYLGFLDNDDELSPDCLFQVVNEINSSDAKVFYTDEDLIGDDGSRHAVFHKPAFNRALLYSHNYITHFVVVDKDLFERTGGLNSEYDGAQDYDLMLRLARQNRIFHHIPQILYHWRAVATSTSIDHDQKPYAHMAGKNALEKHLNDEKTGVHLIDRDLNFHYRIRIDLQVEPSVTVVVLGHEDEDHIQRLSDLTEYKNCTFVSPPEVKTTTGSNNSADQMEQISASKAEAIQSIVDHSTSEFIALLGYGAPRLTPDWLTELVSKSKLEEDIAIVCGRPSYDGSDGPSFALPDLGNPTVSYFCSFLASASRHASGLHNLQYINGCDYHICLIHRSLLVELEGFDFRRFPDHLAMLDLSYRANAIGKKILYTPDAVVTYGKTFDVEIDEDSRAIKEKDYFQQQHRQQLVLFHQWYNLGLLESSGLSTKKFHQWLTGSTG